MYLKSLELHGFKSFPEKTTLHFDAGTTVIVGPNGSGKSNITDAMRWVLGELSSKSIRGSKMEDVIFIGADGRKPMSFAEVSVTFDNTGEQRINSPYDEITVTRRYYRAGESEYCINHKPCRLRDIYELFMNTGIGREGYSIIGQGKIAEIISKKSEDRRGIFEETAGIAKFRYQKEEAEKRLQATDENVARVMDVFSELETRLPPLEKEAQKARKYLELYDQKKQADISLWLYDIDRMTGERDKTESDCRLSAHELEMIADTETSVEAQSDRLFNASMENKQQAQVLYEEIKSLRNAQIEAEGESKVQETNLSHLGEMCEEEKRQIAAASETKKTAEQKGTALRETVREVRALLGEAEENAAEVLNEKSGLTEMRREKEQLLAALQTARAERESALTDSRVKLNVLRNMIADHENRGGTIVGEIETYEKEREGILAELADAKSAVDTYTAGIAEINEELRKTAAVLAGNETAAAETRRRLAEASSEAGAADSRISALLRMQEHFDGYANSVRFVMEAARQSRLRGIRGPVSTLIHVPETYAVAIETALGGALQNIVVDDEGAAKAAIGALKNAGAGRATFYPISSVRGQSRTRELEAASGAPGFEGFADELVSADALYRDIVSSLLGRIAVFRDLDAATSFAKSQSWRVRCVTLDGQQINAGGSFTGGSAKHDSGMLTRNSQIDKLREEKAAIDERIRELRDSLSAGEEASRKAATYRTAEEEKRKLLETLGRSEQTRYDGLSARRDVTEKQLEQLRSDSQNLTEEQGRGETDVLRLQAFVKKEETAIAENEAKRAELESVRAELETQAEALNERLSAAQVTLAERRKDLEAAETAVAGNDAERQAIQDEIGRRQAEVRRLTEEAETIRRNLATRQTASGETERQLSEKETKRRELEDAGMDFEKRLNELRGKLKEIGARKEIIFRAHSKNETKLEQLRIDIDKMTERLWEEYELTRTTAGALGYPEVTYGERAAAAQRLTELRNQLKGLGNVNVASIDECKEVRERYDSMKTRLDDLQKAKDDIQVLISQIETEMKTMFSTAFEQINRHFGEVFVELFGGGQATLTLTDPKDVLNCGIEINVAPPGKMIKSLTLLSGGEQAFVAIALLFALIRVNPSPFCIFDEIEAALDEVNVTRVARYVKRYSEQMQIIMITHRRGTMEVADALYGVTMPRHGISKVFTLDVNDIPREQQELLTRDDAAHT